MSIRWTSTSPSAARVPVVFATAVQPDGKVIIAGSFDSMLGVPRRYIARLNADATLDIGFDPKPNDGVLSVALLVTRP